MQLLCFHNRGLFFVEKTSFRSSDYQTGFRPFLQLFEIHILRYFSQISENQKGSRNLLQNFKKSLKMTIFNFSRSCSLDKTSNWFFDILICLTKVSSLSVPIFSWFDRRNILENAISNNCSLCTKKGLRGLLFDIQNVYNCARHPLIYPLESNWL